MADTISGHIATPLVSHLLLLAYVSTFTNPHPGAALALAFPVSHRWDVWSVGHVIGTMWFFTTALADPASFVALSVFLGFYCTVRGWSMLCVELALVGRLLYLRHT